MRIECLPIWDRIDAAKLLEPAQVAIVRAEVMSWKNPEYRTLEADSPDPQVVVAVEGRLLDWLISHDLLTEYQSQVLKQGNAGPLQIGPLRMVGQIRDWGWPHFYEVESKRRSAPSHLDSCPPSAWAAFGTGLKSTDWSAIRRRVSRLAESKRSKNPHLLVPWGSVVAPPYCAVLFPPAIALPSTSGQATKGAEHLPEAPDDMSLRVCSLAQRLAPELATRLPAPSSKRILQWALDIATGLLDLHESDFAVGYWDPSSVLVTANKRAVLFALPGIFLRTPFLAGALFSGAAALKDVSVLHQALVSGPTPESTWAPLNFLAPELAERFTQVAQAGKTKDAMVASRGWATPAADMYCLGSTLAWLFSSSTTSGSDAIKPFPSVKLPTQTWPVPTTVPGPIRALIEKLWSIDPLQRPSASDAIQSLRHLMKQSIEPTLKLSVVSAAAQELQAQCGGWPDRCWTNEVDSIKASEIPELVKAVEVPHIVIQTELVTDRVDEVRSARTGSGVAGPTPEGSPLRRFRKPSKRVWSPPLVACVASASAAILFLMWWVLAGPETTDMVQRDDSKPTENLPPAGAVEDAVAIRPTGWQQSVIPDDGRLLWESPTVGLPLEVSGLPDNPTGLLVVHRDFWKTGKTVAALLRALDGPTPTESAQTIMKWRSAYQVDQFARTVVAQYQSLSEVEHVMMFDNVPSVEVSLAGWKLIATLEIPAAPATNSAQGSETAPSENVSVLNEASAEDSMNPAVVDGTRSPDATQQQNTSPPDNRSINSEATEKANEVVFHYLLARSAAEGNEAAWLQTSAPLTADLADGLALAQWDQVGADVFDPTNSEVTLDERKLYIRRLVVGPPELIAATIHDRGATQFAGTMASLLAYSDQDRHLQLFINPVTIWNSQGQDWLGARWQWLGQLVKDRVPTAVRMMGLSLHLLESGESYVEVKVVGDRARPVGEVLGPMIDEISKMPEAVKRKLLDLPRVQYWENAMLRYDGMLQDVSGLVRAGQHDRLPTMNVWLRPTALENLVAATEVFFLATRTGGGTTLAQEGPSLPKPEANTPKNLAELLRSPLSLSIPEQDLINALVELETEIKSAHPKLPFEFTIDLDGNSLRLDGITQNQKITNFQQKDRPLAEILTALVLKANPDPAVTDARDPKCKLIWLIDPTNPEGRVRVTTRSAAQENGWTLPPELTPEQ
ncbi:MAG: hypothetical protein JNL67_18815 [Planctomycetaceae bacterium]|nr:hypothetical protein [Planctomycetaceae bacterium]